MTALLLSLKEINFSILQFLGEEGEMRFSHPPIVPVFLLSCITAKALLLQGKGVSSGMEMVKKVDAAKRTLTDSHNGRIQTPEQASKSFNCSAIPVSNKLFNLSALNQDWKVISDTDAMMINPCAPLHYSNDFCPVGQTSLCLLEKTGGSGIASFGRVSKVLLSPKGIIILTLSLEELVLLYTSGMFTNEGLPITSVVRFVCDPQGKKVM